MEEIIYRQHDAAKRLDGKGFLLSIAGILLRLAVAQIAVNLLITLTGMGLINLAFYGYAVWLLIAFMRRTVANYVYTLKDDVLVLDRRLGDSTALLVQIPLDKVVSLRPVHMGERLYTSYRQVTVIDPACRPAARVRAAFLVSLISAKLARMWASRDVDRIIGHVAVYTEGKETRVCVFRPDEQMLAALEERLGDAFGFDERMARARVKTLYARALERAFPQHYGYVEPLVSREDVEWARAEMDARKEARRAKKQAKGAAAANAPAEKKPEDRPPEKQSAQEQPDTEQPDTEQPDMKQPDMKRPDMEQKKETETQENGAEDKLRRRREKK